MYQSAALYVAACATAVVFAVATPEARAAEPVAPVARVTSSGSPDLDNVWGTRACEAGFKCITEADSDFVGPRRPSN